MLHKEHKATHTTQRNELLFLVIVPRDVAIWDFHSSIILFLKSFISRHLDVVYTIPGTMLSTRNIISHKIKFIASRCRLMGETDTELQNFSSIVIETCYSSRHIECCKNIEKDFSNFARRWRLRLSRGGRKVRKGLSVEWNTWAKSWKMTRQTKNREPLGWEACRSWHMIWWGYYKQLVWMKLKLYVLEWQKIELKSTTTYSEKTLWKPDTCNGLFWFNCKGCKRFQVREWQYGVVFQKDPTEYFQGQFIIELTNSET